MSRPDIRTTVEQKSTPAYEVGDLWVGAVDGTTRLNGVEMSITPYESTGNGNYGYDDDIDISDQYYEADSDFGFVLETTGVTWDLSDFISELLDQEETHPALESAREYKTFEDVSERESALATAAHFLTLTIADITGAGTQLLLYGIDKENDRVHVFDQTQGGQGIIELFYKEMERNPKAALDAVYRLIDNSQVLNDILWAQTTDSDTPNPWERILETIDVSVLSEEAESEARMEEIEKLKQITTETLKIDYEKSLKRVAEEIASTTQRLYHFAEESNIEPAQFYELKHELARARQNGASSDEIPDDIISEFEAIFEDENIQKETIRSLLYPPDMDGCRANLHLNTSIVSDVDQEDVLSFAFLRALADYVVDRIDIDRRDKIAEQGRTWGRIIDDEVEYLSWGDDI